MKIICKKNDLIESINIALRAVPSKTTMPILECIVIEVEDKISFISNDMEIGIRTDVKGDIVERGTVAVNAKIFADIIRKLPEEEVVISTDYDFNTNIKCGKSKFNIKGSSSEEFPPLPVISRERSISISQFSLKEIIRQTIISIADNDLNKIMTGELFEIKNGILRVVSIDGQRFSIRRINLSENYNNISVIVPGKTLIEISKILTGGIDEIVNIYFSSENSGGTKSSEFRNILFEFNNTLFNSRLIEGKYFRIDQMISNDYETKVTINRKEMLECIDRSTLFIKESDKKPIVIKVTDNNMQFKINSVIGSMNEDIDITKEGMDIVIGFNPRYLIDALKVIDDEEINIYLFNPKAPCFIRDDEEKYLYLIMPMLNIGTEN